MDAFCSVSGDALAEGIEYALDGRSRPEPTIEPGQIWLAETCARSLYPFHVQIIGRADVVIYGRALAPIVARALPLGAYAEKLPLADACVSAISPRARQFAAEGWRVVQLVEARGGRGERLRSAARTLHAPNGGDDLQLLAIGAITADRHVWGSDAAGRLADDALLILVCAPPGFRRPAQGHAFTANGLAG